MALHAHGIDLRPVVGSRQRKSIGKERTFEPLLTDKNKALSFLRQCAQDVANKLQEKGLIATVVTLKIRNQKFETQTKQMQLKATRDAMDIFDGAKELFDSMPQYLDAGIRLLGLSVSGIRKSKYEEIELPLFSTEW